jgi:ribosomal protein L3 glutamine methyltransferase
MINSYDELTVLCVTIIDFLRFGISESNRCALHYGHGTDNAYDDIFALILASLSLPADTNIALLQARLTDDEKILLTKQLKHRIVDRIPVPYLTKNAFFCGLSFYVDKRVLIPRSPIAEMIDNQFSPWVEPERVHRILDLCTGSGCIAIACSYIFPDVLIDAVDLSKDALEVAAINRDRHGLDDTTLNLIESDCWDHVPPNLYDIIIANPPYVGDSEMANLPSEYHHEPMMALQANNNGLAIIEKIINHAHEYLTKDGILIVEVGNSEYMLVDAYPEIPFTWLEFENGGSGIFLLTAGQLNNYFG